MKLPPLNIKDPEVYRLAKALSTRTGETLTEAVKNSLRERLDRQPRFSPDREIMLGRIQLLVERASELPVLDARTPDEIIGYDEQGIPE